MMYGVAMNARDSISGYVSMEQIAKNIEAIQVKADEVRRLQEEIDSIEKIYFKHRTESQDQYLNECYNQLGAWKGVA